MQDLKHEEMEKTKERQRMLEERVPPLDLDGLSEGSAIETYELTRTILTLEVT